MTPDGNEGLVATQLAPPSPTDPTRTSEPLPAGTPNPAPTSDAAPASPRVRDPERYQILGEHGRGGLGRVSRAHDRELGRDIAIKELISRGHLAEVRFLREALITARLEHPGIVPVYEAGRWADGTPFYAMKLVAGRSLRELLDERTTVDERLALLHHVIAVADAIAYAHGRNIIHRDLKPANVIVGDFGETVVIDWGLAKDITAPEESTVGGGPFRANRDDGLTSAGSVLGTPAYMAPEQERGELVDQRADVFAIGAMLWELCTLQKLPPGFTGQRRRILRAGIDPDLTTIIDKALDPDPARRYSDAGPLAADLKAFKTGARITARRYSLFALLAHWIRRHRALALSITAALTLTTIGCIFYVYTITIERDRADTMRDRADAALTTAQQERDRAQLAEASLLLEKDPTRAQALLLSLTTRTPQYALLLNRAKQLAAVHSINFSGNIVTLLPNPSFSHLAAITSVGQLAIIDAASYVFRTLDNKALGAATTFHDRWLYSSRSQANSSVFLKDTTKPHHILNVGTLLLDTSQKLLTIGERIYALDNTDLYELGAESPLLISHGIRDAAGNERFFMTCSTTGVLVVLREGKPERTARCAQFKGTHPLFAAGDHYAALLDERTLLLVRSGKPLELPIHIAGEFALALSTSGVVALSDFDGKTWLVRSGRDLLEPGPPYPARPKAVATQEQYVAWGYADGTVIAMDTITDAIWTFRGHSNTVTSLEIDIARSRLISTAGSELRVWNIAPQSLSKIADIRCRIFNLNIAKNGRSAAMDCADGRLRTWSFATNRIQELHQHQNLAFGVTWWRGLACSGGFDGRVICTSPSGASKEIMAGGDPVTWLIASPGDKALIIATRSGSIKEYDESLRTLYSHNARAYRMAMSSDARYLASGAFDGSVVIYDYTQHKIVTQLTAHGDLVSNVAWRDHELWTAGFDGVLKHWQLSSDRLIITKTIHEAGAFRFFHLLHRGWVANVDDRFLLISVDDGAKQLRFDLGRHVERIEISPDERYVAATVPDETVVVDLEHDLVAALHILSDGVSYIGFIGNITLAVSTGSTLFSMSTEELPFTHF